MSQHSAYRVLARTYRPQRFDDLIGQEVLVRTLTNAFASGRIAHAFLMTGIRGIGKTTTARIIARGLNCTGIDGTGGPTTDPCGECSNCRMILEERHMDIIEMDAASRTGVDDIREIIDTIHYAPVSARYKVYIIDEVHMLSKNAFNALLKTLEEPPAHVKFIFATTEIRKIPITIISRCQRFDLRRISLDTLVDHLANVCAKEKVSAEKETLKLIATAAEGSVRDSLSLLDQAIAMHSAADGLCTLDEARIRDMLGIAGKANLLALLDAVFAADAPASVRLLQHMHQHGSDPLMVLQELLALVHQVTRIQVDASLANNPLFSEEERQRLSALAATTAMPVLARVWQMLLKGMDEIRSATDMLAAAEMILIRLAYAAPLPPPDALIRQIQQGGAQAAQAAPALFQPAPMAQTETTYRGNLALAAMQEPLAIDVPAPKTLANPQSFEEVVVMFQEKREMVLYSHLYNDMRLVSFSPGTIEIQPTQPLGAEIAARISRHLSEWCGQPWRLRYGETDAASQPTLREKMLKIEQQRLDYVAVHPDMQAIRQWLGDTEIMTIIPLEKKEQDA